MENRKALQSSVPNVKFVNWWAPPRRYGSGGRRRPPGAAGDASGLLVKGAHVDDI